MFYKKAIKFFGKSKKNYTVLIFSDSVFCALLRFSDILERNNDYSDTLDFRRGSVGVFAVFVLEVPDYKFAMLIYLCTRSVQ